MLGQAWVVVVEEAFREPDPHVLISAEALRCRGRVVQVVDRNGVLHTDEAQAPVRARGKPERAAEYRSRK